MESVTFDPFGDFLIKLSDDIPSDKSKRMVEYSQLLKPKPITIRESEKFKGPLDLFKALRSHGHLSKDNGKVLVCLLEKADCMDIAETVKKRFASRFIATPSPASEHSQEPSMNQAIDKSMPASVSPKPGIDSMAGKEETARPIRFSRPLRAMRKRKALTTTHDCLKLKGFSDVSSEECQFKPLPDLKNGKSLSQPKGLLFIDDRLAVCDTGNNIVHIISKDYDCEAELGTFDGRFPKPFMPVNVVFLKEFYILDNGNLQVVVCDEANIISTLIPLYRPGNAREPTGIALLNEFILVSDQMGDKVMKLAKNGKVSGEIKERRPHSVVVNANKVIMVTEQVPNSCITRYNSDLEVLGQFCSTGTANGQLLYPRGICVDEDDNVYVCDLNNYRIVKLKPTGEWENNFNLRRYAPDYVSVARDGRIAVACNTEHNGIVLIYSPPT